MTTEEIITCGMCNGSGRALKETGEIDLESRGLKVKKVIPCRPCRGTGRMFKVVSTIIKPFDQDVFDEFLKNQGRYQEGGYNEMY